MQAQFSNIPRMILIVCKNYVKYVRNECKCEKGDKQYTGTRGKNVNKSINIK